MFYKTNWEALAVNLLDHLEETTRWVKKCQREAKSEVCRTVWGVTGEETMRSVRTVTFYETLCKPFLECSLSLILAASLAQTHLYVTEQLCMSDSYLSVNQRVCQQPPLCAPTLHIFLLETIGLEEARHRCGRAFVQVLILHLLRCRFMHLSLTRLRMGRLLLRACTYVPAHDFAVHLVLCSRMQMCALQTVLPFLRAFFRKVLTLHFNAKFVSIINELEWRPQKTHSWMCTDQVSAPHKGYLQVLYFAINADCWEFTPAGDQVMLWHNRLSIPEAWSVYTSPAVQITQIIERCGCICPRAHRGMPMCMFYCISPCTPEKWLRLHLCVWTLFMHPTYCVRIRVH